MNLGLDHVQIAAPAGCEGEARAFYGVLLGLTEVEKPDALKPRGGCWFALADGRQLHVGVEDPFVPARKAHPAFRVAGGDELRGLAARLEGAGSSVTWDQEISGIERFYVGDPFGNRLEFLTPGL